MIGVMPSSLALVDVERMLIDEVRDDVDGCDG
jgi:hypothetical protein